MIRYLRNLSNDLYGGNRKMEQQQVRGINNVDHSPFISNVQAVAHQPDKFILDFKGVFPQFTPDNQMLHVANHRIILLDPYHAKEFLKILKNNLDNYEKKFGKIKKPEQIKKAKKEAKKIKKNNITKTKRPEYMG